MRVSQIAIPVSRYAIYWSGHVSLKNSHQAHFSPASVNKKGRHIARVHRRAVIAAAENNSTANFSLIKCPRSKDEEQTP